MDSYRNIGKIAASSGLQGLLVLVHHLGKRTSLKGLKVIFIETSKDIFLPYFIQSTRIKSDNEIFIQLEDIDTLDKTKTLLQKQVWLPELEFNKYVSATAPSKMLGFHIINQGIEIGTIQEIIEQPHQILCRIEKQGKDVLIPLHEETIEKIDRKNKKLFLKLPDGLLDIYK